jgi:hypothetical protein
MSYMQTACRRLCLFGLMNWAYVILEYEVGPWWVWSINNVVLLCLPL